MSNATLCRRALFRTIALEWTPGGQIKQQPMKSNKKKAVLHSLGFDEYVIIEVGDNISLK